MRVMQLDRAMIFTYLIIVILTYFTRQISWALSSPVTEERLPYYDPVDAPYFQAVFEHWCACGRSNVESAQLFLRRPRRGQFRANGKRWRWRRILGSGLLVALQSRPSSMHAPCSCRLLGERGPVV